MYTKLNREQLKAVKKFWRRVQPLYPCKRQVDVARACGIPGIFPDKALSYRQFRSLVQPEIGNGDDCVLVPWAGMWIAVEHNGYAHT